MWSMFSHANLARCFQDAGVVHRCDRERKSGASGMEADSGDEGVEDVEADNEHDDDEEKGWGDVGWGSSKKALSLCSRTRRTPPPRQRSSAADKTKRLLINTRSCSAPCLTGACVERPHSLSAVSAFFCFILRLPAFPSRGRLGRFSGALSDFTRAPQALLVARRGPVGGPLGGPPWIARWFH